MKDMPFFSVVIMFWYDRYCVQKTKEEGLVLRSSFSVLDLELEI